MTIPDYNGVIDKNTLLKQHHNNEVYRVINIYWSIVDNCWTIELMNIDRAAFEVFTEYLDVVERDYEVIYN